MSALPNPLYNLTGAVDGDGANPTAGLTLDVAGKNLYGTTFHGGTGGCGTVVEYPLPNGPEAVNYSFTAAPTDGGNPWGGMIFDPLVSGTLLYGTTVNGGASGFGVAYSK